MATGDLTGDGQYDDELRAALTRLVKQLLRDDEPAARRADDLMPILDAHLGVAADELPVVVEPISAYSWADTDIALASIVARDPEAKWWAWEVATNGTTAPWAT